jgi:mannose PTS system EIIC component
MSLSALCIGALVAVVVGLDRTAALQLMISRPLVAGPLAGWLLGEPLTGLLIGALVELLWLGRLPVGAAIPPDDTQVAVAASVLTIGLGPQLALSQFPLALLCTLVAMPLGKVGQLFDRWARQRNGRLLLGAEAAVLAGELRAIPRQHLWGLGHFALASLATYLVIVLSGWGLLLLLASSLVEPIARVGNWLWLAFPLVGTAALLATINVGRSLTLFSAAFVGAFLMLWLL